LKKPKKAQKYTSDQQACSRFRSNSYLTIRFFETSSTPSSRITEIFMGIFGSKTPNHLVPIHCDNISNKDWVILLEAGTIVGPSPERVRVARATQEKRIVKKYDFLLRPRHFIVVEGYNPRIHALYFCPQLFRYETNRFVALQGEEIGQLVARAVEGTVAERHPWYGPTDGFPDDSAIRGVPLSEFDSLVVELPPKHESLPPSSQPLLTNQVGNS
jgi:hypothetical protein